MNDIKGKKRFNELWDDKNTMPALDLLRTLEFQTRQNRKWVIYDSAYGRFGNSGNWYTSVVDADIFNTIDEAKKAIKDYGYGPNAVPAFSEIDIRISF